MASSVVAWLHDLWDACGIRGFMILSLMMQLLLAIVSPLRKRTSNHWVILLIWSAYFLADWAAIFAFGLISNARFMNSTSPTQVDQRSPGVLVCLSSNTPGRARFHYCICTRGQYAVDASLCRPCSPDARATFDILKMELKFFYEVFYTKVLAANSAWGVLIRSLAFYSVLIALIMFCLIKKEGIHSTIAFREWSESTGALSILRRAFEESRPRKGSKLCDYWRKINDKVRAVHEARGEGPLRNTNLAELRRYVDDLELENSILIWHCATEICYQDDRHIDGDSNKRRKFSKVLSDYMVYLLIKQPKLMSPVAGIEKIRYRDTCVEAKNIGKGHLVETMDQFCKNILDEHMGTAKSEDRTGKGKSMLSDACTIANTLRQKGSTKWDVISEVWVEVLLYAAGHCRADSHVRLLSEGGELITFVWLLMAHLGIIARFPKE
ncbi:hypothetical protein MLD38_037706 [Melastoma candidum]|uniref:Uncharacterized protein n=1 Tax=Melastoma candidum TaxID=119954 RepID=A0ACB9LP82_9MYRT|nr:hypothetical protein MLD38_037706 [Melastoma candidum]